jgi:hypothetical protein
MTRTATEHYPAWFSQSRKPRRGTVAHDAFEVEPRIIFHAFIRARLSRKTAAQTNI